MKFSSNTSRLPKGYQLTETVNLQTDKKQAVIVNSLGSAIMVVLILAGFLFHPLSSFFDGSYSFFIRLAVLCGLLIAYVFLHEIVHGIFMHAFSNEKVQYGFTGMYAYAGSSAYFNKPSYFIIALAPVVIWGIVIAPCLIWVPASWWWVFYFLEVYNLGGAAGDLYVVWKFSRLPDTVLFQDSGIEMKVYLPASDL